MPSGYAGSTETSLWVLKGQRTGTLDCRKLIGGPEECVTMAQRPRAASQPGRPAPEQSPRPSKGARRRASSTLTSPCLEEELMCPVCCEIFREPVVLKCSHSMCRSCLQQVWRRSPGGRECPVCRQRCSLSEPPVSIVLKNVAESFLRQQGPAREAGRSETPVPEIPAQCSAHGEPLRLFCQDDDEVLCFVCHTSKRHVGHQVCPLDEAASDLKNNLKKELGPLKKNLRKLYEAKQECDDTGVYIKNQLQWTEQQIKQDFEQLRQFLRTEEEQRIMAVREEYEKKWQQMKKRTDSLSHEILHLSQAIIAIDNEIASKDTLFLQNYKNTTKRAQCTTQDPEKVAGVLIDVAQHLSSLKYRVWEKMVGLVKYTPVTLDPNTAYSWLSVSDDLTTVTNSGPIQEVPDNPERFNHLVFVLGAEGFVSGQQTWEVEVGDKEDWVLGVVKESINRKGKVSGRPEDGFWTIAHCEGEFTAMTTPRTQLKLNGTLERVRVHLDYDSGQVAFSNPVTMTPIYTFNDRFTERMFPFFCPGANINSRPLKVCAARVAVWNSTTW